MKRIRFLALALAALAGSTTAAAPVPKDAPKAEAAPDLKPVFEAVEKAAKGGKWPAEKDEKLLREAARAVFERATDAAGQKGRKFPVDFQAVAKSDVVKELKGGRVAGAFVIAGKVELTAAKDSVIFATGDVQVTRATNCVIFAKSLRANAADNCLIVAGDSIRAVGADRRDREEGSVLVAGRLIRVTGARGAICHVIHPSLGQQFPGEEVGDPASPPIRLTTANAVTVLNAAEHWKAATNKNGTAVVPKTPIAK
jgi:hypothetical protein